MRTLGAEQEADRLLGHVEGRHVVARLQVAKVSLDLSAIALLERDVDGEPRERALVGVARDLRRQCGGVRSPRGKWLRLESPQLHHGQC